MFSLLSRLNFVKCQGLILILVLFLNIEVYGEVFYGVSGQFTLAVPPSSPGPAAGFSPITNIRVEDIAYVTKTWGNTWTGTVKYNLSAPKMFIWLEFSKDGGSTWSLSDISGIGDIGPAITSGNDKTISWRIDGDQGSNCFIRIRANDDPATYQEYTALNNPFPTPLPTEPYESIERLVSEVEDGFNFKSLEAVLPSVDFTVDMENTGQAMVGFARATGIHDPRPNFYVWVMYISIGGKEFVISSHDIEVFYTADMNNYKQAVQDGLGIPKEHIMMLMTHYHGPNGTGNTNLYVNLVAAAKLKAKLAKMAYGKIDEGSSYNIHRDCILSATDGRIWGDYMGNGGTNDPIIWQYDGGGNVIGALVDAMPQLEKLKTYIEINYQPVTVDPITGNNAQLYFDGARDSEFHFFLFKDMLDNPIGSFFKFTGHFVHGEFEYLCDYLQQKWGGDRDSFMYTIGFGGNHRGTEIDLNQDSQLPSTRWGGDHIGWDFSEQIMNLLPSLEFKPMTKVGVVNGFGNFGTSTTLQNVLIQSFCLNDVFIPVLPCEAPGEQGLYIRAKTSGYKVFYTAYGNHWAQYYTWGRWFDRRIYENWNLGQQNRYDSFRMAEESIRGVNILKKVMDISPSIPPTVTTISPLTGSNLINTTINITGTGFYGGGTSSNVEWIKIVSIDNQYTTNLSVPSPSFVTDTTITGAVIPAGAHGHTYNVRVKTYSGGNNDTSSDKFVVTTTVIPTVSNIVPSTGSDSSTLTVSILGSGFYGGGSNSDVRSIKIDNGTNNYNLSNWNATSDTTIINGIIPSGCVSGTYNVQVTTGGGTNSTSAVKFVVKTGPKVTNILPSSGVNNSATTVSITGTGFYGEGSSSDVSSVKINSGSYNYNVTGCSVTSDSTIVNGIVPGGCVVGTYNVQVTTSIGTNLTSSVKFVVTAPITGVVIDTTNTTDTVFAAAKDRRLVLTSDGKIVAFYTKGGGTDAPGPLYYSISSDNGSTWSSATLIGGTNWDAYRSSVWKDSSDHIYVVYCYNNDVMMKKMTYNAGSYELGAERTVALSTETLYAPRVSIAKTSGGIIWVSYTYNATGVGAEVRARYSNDDGATWSAYSSVYS
ncbi:MAG: IPT/TIG domain-containing protein, partial [Candidatus Firestonebacteria bacterium]